MSTIQWTRRGMGALAAAAFAAPPDEPALPAQIAQLRLPPELAADLRERAAAAVREAQRLEDLPLEGIDPGFSFRPIRED